MFQSTVTKLGPLARILRDVNSALTNPTGVPVASPTERVGSPSLPSSSLSTGLQKMVMDSEITGYVKTSEGFFSILNECAMYQQAPLQAFCVLLTQYGI